MGGVTFIANFFYWSHQPILPVLGAELGASPGQIGLLSSASFCGGLIVAVLFSRRSPRCSGATYCIGITLADLALVGAGAGSFAWAVASLFASGVFAGLFMTVQLSMVLSMVPGALQGRALGTLSLAIAAGPFGMAALGKLAAMFGGQALRY